MFPDENLQRQQVGVVISTVQNLPWYLPNTSRI